MFHFSHKNVISGFNMLACKGVRDEVNLKAGYVNEQLSLVKATEANPVGIIRGKRRGVLLSRFGATQLTRKAKYPARSTGRMEISDSRAKFKAIPAGKKAAGVSVKVSRNGSRKKMRSAFPLKFSNGSVGVAIRTGKGKGDFKVVYGPSVDQVMRTLKPQLSRLIETEFDQIMESQLRYELGRIKGTNTR